jgi:anti-sigma B factor antagonist
MELTIDEGTDATGARVLTLRGALDLASREQLAEAGKAALEDTDVSGLVLDLSGVGFLDSTGLGAIIELAGDSEDASRSFSLRAPSERVTKVLTVCGMADAWPITD